MQRHHKPTARLDSLLTILIRTFQGAGFIALLGTSVAAFSESIYLRESEKWRTGCNQDAMTDVVICFRLGAFVTKNASGIVSIRRSPDVSRRRFMDLAALRFGAPKIRSKVDNGEVREHQIECKEDRCVLLDIERSEQLVLEMLEGNVLLIETLDKAGQRSSLIRFGLSEFSEAYEDAKPNLARLNDNSESRPQ